VLRTYGLWGDGVGASPEFTGRGGNEAFEDRHDNDIDSIFGDSGSASDTLAGLSP
jgi:hypothetical protein